MIPSMAKPDQPSDRFDWVEIGGGAETMTDARRRLGKSREAVAREIGVSLKTYERYESAGRVPVQRLDAVANALNLQIVRRDRRPVKATLSKRDEDRLKAVERIARETRDEVMALRQEVAATLRWVLRFAQRTRKPPE